MNRLPVIVRQHIAGFRILLVFTVICGFIYPLVMLGVAQVAFHNKANGSLVSYNGHVVGSGLLCQEFVDAKGNPLPQCMPAEHSDQRFITRSHRVVPDGLVLRSPDDRRLRLPAPHLEGDREL